MPRCFEVSLPPEKADVLLERIDGVEGVVGIVRHRQAAIRPPGDLLSIQLTNDATRQVLEVIADLQVVQDGSLATTEPRCVVAPDYQDLVNGESNETIWDEMAFLLRQDTNLAPNYLLLMMLAGAVSAVGLWTDHLHLVIGAMVIAPAFEPLAQIPFGMIVGPRRCAASGAKSAAAGYLLLALGGLLTVSLLQVIDASRSAELESRSWVQYWSTVSPTGVLVSVFAAAAGGFVISGQRSVLTTGVMIALALVPSMAIVGMGVGVGEFSLAGRGLIRWLIDAVVVVVISALIVTLKRMYLQRHRALS